MLKFLKEQDEDIRKLLDGKKEFDDEDVLKIIKASLTSDNLS